MAIDWSQWLDWLPVADTSGEELKPRTLRLKLDVPGIRTGSRRAKSKLEEPPEKWRELNAHPIELLRDIDRYLQRVNTEQLSDAKRLTWVEHSLTYACPAIRKIYSEYYKSEALPESHDRREGIVAAINVCRQLAYGYKRQLNTDFALSDKRYRRVRARVRMHALRVLELIRMEQRLCAMRYQKLSEKAWRDCNQIYFAISQCEDTEESAQGLTCLQVYLDTPENEAGRRSPVMTSINLVYLSIQLNGLFDSNTIACQKLHVVDAQVARILNVITIIPDHGKPLGRGKLLIYQNQDGPAFFERKDEQQRKKQDEWMKSRGELASEDELRSIIVDVAPLDALLMNEHQQHLQRFESFDVTREEKNKYQTVTDQDDLANLLTIDAMCDGMHLKQRQEEREYIIGQKILYVYNGFMSVYKLLVDMAAKNEEEHPELVVDSELRDALAGRSALIAADLEASEFGQWFVLDKSPGGVHMKTRESEFTTALFIGQVVAFAFSRDELVKPMLGYVVRLRRGKNKEMEVTLRIVSTSVVATAVQSDFLRKNDMALPAIVMDVKGERQLMLHHSHRLPPGTEIQIEVDHEKKARIADVVKFQREFVIYSLQADE